MPTGVLVLTDAFLSIGGTTLSTDANKIEIPVEVDELDVTVFGGVWKKRTGGLLDGKLNASFLNRYDAAGLDELTWNWVIGRTPVAFVVRPTSAAVGGTNPQWSGLVLPKSYSPIAGDVGNLNKFDISWPTSGAVTRATA